MIKANYHENRYSVGIHCYDIFWPLGSRREDSVNSPRDTVIVKVSKKDSTANDGSSFDKAIYITEDHETPGIHAEYEWIKNKYPGYKNRGQSLSYRDQKPFDIIHITTADGKQTDIYFDISKFFGKF